MLRPGFFMTINAIDVLKYTSMFAPFASQAFQRAAKSFVMDAMTLARRTIRPGYQRRRRESGVGPAG